MAWGNILLDRLIDRPRANKALQALIAKKELAGPTQDGTPNYGTNSSAVNESQALAEYNPIMALKHMTNATSPQGMMARESNQLKLDSERRKAQVTEQLEKLIRSGARSTPEGQQKINDLMTLLVPSQIAGNRKKPHGSPFLNKDGNMVAPVWNPIAQNFETTNLGAADPNNVVNTTRGGVDLIPTRGSGAGTSREVVSPEVAGQGQGEAEVTKENELRAYQDRMDYYDSNAETTIDHIDEALKHENFGSAYGIESNWPDALTFSGAGRNNFLPYLEQAAGGAFMQGFEMLKGGGQITEIEAKKAEEALARIQNRDQSDEEARKAWVDYRAALETGLKKLQSRETVNFAKGVAGETSYSDFVKGAKIIRQGQ